jgi:hypothetical protein
MCTEPDHAAAVAAWAIRPESRGRAGRSGNPGPVDAVTLTTLVDNSTDLLLADQGPVLESFPHALKVQGRAC